MKKTAKHYTQTFVVVGLGFFLFLGLATMVTISNSRQSRDSRSQASITTDPTVFFEPAEFEADFVGEQFEVGVRINTNNQVTGGVSGRIDYNPDHLVVKNIDLGSFFKQVKITNPQGKIVFDSNEKVIGEGTIATITFEVASNSFNQSSIELNDDFIVWDSTNDYNALIDIPQPVTVFQD